MVSDNHQGTTGLLQSVYANISDLLRNGRGFSRYAAFLTEAKIALMETDARILMDELRLDHRNMAIVLNIMDGLLEEMEDGKDPDFELLEEIMRYMTIYPDAVHHPKEDVMYEKLRAKRPDLAEDLDHVPDDHRDIARLGSVLRKKIAFNKRILLKWQVIMP